MFVVIRYHQFLEISIQTHAFESLCGSLWREQQRDEFAVNLCRIARLRELTILYAAASFARSVTLRLFLLAQKKSTDGKTGLQKAYVRMRC